MKNKYLTKIMMILLIIHITGCGQEEDKEKKKEAGYEKMFGDLKTSSLK